MITDAERRKVAANLRDSAGNAEVLRDVFLEEILAGDTGLWFAEDIEIDILLYHLADLIEPSIPSDPGEAGLASVEGFIGEMRHSTKEEQDLYDGMLEKMSVEIHPVDRDALLRLAKSLDAQAECRIKSNDIIAKRGDRSRNMAIAKDLFGIACEIRNALGVKS